MDSTQRMLICSSLAIMFLFAGGANADIDSPVQVELAMPAFPMVGQEATVNCTIKSRIDLTGVSVTIDLPKGVDLTKGSKTWQGNITAFQDQSFQLAVKVVSPGNKTIRATVLCRLDADTAYSDVAQVFFNSGTGVAVAGHLTDLVPTEAASTCLETGETAQPTLLTEAMKRPVSEVVLPDPCSAGPGDPRPVTGGPPVGGTLTVSGRWCYYDRDDDYTPMNWVYVELRRGTDDAVLTSEWIGDNNGEYTFPAITNPGSAGFRVRAWCFHNSTYSSDGKALRVVGLGDGRSDGGNTVSPCYSVQSGIHTSADGTHDMGTWHVNNGDVNEPAWWIMMDLNRGFWWPYWWNSHTTMNGGVTVEWSSTSTHGNHNHRDGEDGGNIHLTADAPEICDVVLHEYGHEVQWDGYGAWLPSSDCPSPHYFEVAGGPHCGWYEGFANWYKFAVTNDPVYHWPGGGSLNLENPSWGAAGWDNGDEVEGRVAGALWDIGDPGADGYDTCDIDWEVFWDTWYGSSHRDNTLPEFWTRWKNVGNPKHHPMKALYQNTIDYNTWPTFSGLLDRTMNEDASWNNAIDLWSCANDADSGDSELIYTITGNSNASCGVSIDSNRYVDINPALNWNGISTVTISCTDGIRTLSDSFVVTVYAINDAPSISGLPDRSLSEDGLLNNTIDLWAYTTDPESADSSLTFTITANTNSGCGVSIDSNRYIDIDPSSNWNGYSDVTIRATDPSGLWDADTFRITVNAVNDAPTISGLPDRNMNEDAYWNNAIDLWSYSSDPESIDDDLTYTITGNTNTSCGVSVDSGRYIDIDPVDNWYGASTVTVRATDPSGLWSDDAFVINVYSINDPPTLANLPNKFVAKSSVSNNAIDLRDYADDVETPDYDLVYTISANTDTNCGVVLDASGYVDIAPTAGWTGYSDVTIRAADAAGDWAEDTFRVVVASVYPTIGQARNAPDGSWVAVQGKITTARFSSYYYIEEPSRSSGIRIATTSGYNPGYGVTVAGPLSTSYAERQITPYYQGLTDEGVWVQPLGIVNQNLGGKSPNAYTPSVPSGAVGLYNVGMLVRATGHVVSQASGGRFFIADGSSTVDNSTGEPSVLVEGVPSGYQPPVGTYVSVAGISGATTLGGNPMRILRPRDDGDIQVRRLKAAYIYDTGETDAQSFRSLLNASAVETNLVLLSKLARADLSSYHVILIGSDTGSWADPAAVGSVLAPGTPIIGIGAGGAHFLDAVTTPALYIGWGNSALGSNETHATVQGGGIYSYPNTIPYTPGQTINLYNSPGTSAVTLWDPTGSVSHYLNDYHIQGYAPLCAEQNRFYQWGFYGAPDKMTGWGHALFVNLVFGTVSH